MIQKREMTAKEKKAIRKLVIAHCVNYDSEYGCLPLECDCYMFGKWYTGSFCKYFESHVLPLDPLLEAKLLNTGVSVKHCKICSKPFKAKGRKVYCCTRCEQEGRRQATAARVRKHRSAV